MTSRIPYTVVLLVAACYSAFAALVSYWFTHLTGLSLWTLEADSSATFSYILAMNLLLWGSWALFAPLAFALAQRFRLDRPGWRRALCVHVTAAIAITGAHIVFVSTARYWLQLGWGVPTGWLPNVRDAFFRTLDFELPVYWALVGLQHALDYFGEVRAREVVSAQLEAALLEAELEALQRQLHPHFMFNTLHAISALVQREPQKAEEMIERLSDLLRVTLHRVGDQEVTLRDELAYLTAYLDIQQVHFGDRLQITYAIDDSALDLMVPNLLLQPLVENSIRHGLEPQTRRGRLSVAAVRDNELLTLVVADNGRGIDGIRGGSHGVGLSNTRARLERLYGGQATLSLEDNEDGGVTARITLPVRTRVLEDGSSRERGRSVDGARAAVGVAV